MAMRRIACLVGLYLFSSIVSLAACTGSGTTWSCPAGASVSDVQSVVNNASNGATVTFASGSYNWSGQIALSQSKGITLICATPQACNVSVSTYVVGVPNIVGDNNNFYRISGFAFDGGGRQLVTGVIWFGYGGGSPGILEQVRIDHNTFSNLAENSRGIFFGGNDYVSDSFGVIDHNTLHTSDAVTFLQMIGSPNPAPPPSSLGTIKNMFVEDNTITWDAPTDASVGGCTDSWGDARIVWRHNTTTNCLVTAHGVTHGGGPANFEVYNNTLVMNSGSVKMGTSDCYRCFHHQGSGEIIAFNNNFTAYSGKNSEVISVLHYRDYPNSIDGGMAQCDGTQSIDGNRSGTYGYPCWRQPGRDPATSKLMPMYAWNNYWSDTKAQVPMNVPDYGGTPDYYSYHMQKDREWYNAVSASAQTSQSYPFTGDTGMGFGTLANRPATCTTNPNENGGGVGYFATDQGTQGTLYQCSSTNTWTSWYTPYAYPHPLVQSGGSVGSGVGSTPPPPAAPGAPRSLSGSVGTVTK